MRRDADAKSAVERSKNDFYSNYSYLKPECEKNAFEHICDGLQTTDEWLKEHWKLIVTVVIVVVAVVLLCTGVGSGLGAVLLAGACWGAIMGACIGGVAGGIGSMMNGGSFLSGFEDGAFSGAIGGAIGGAVSAGLGAAIGPALTFTGSIVRGAAIGAASSGVSNMGVSTINYLIENKTLEGSGNVIISSGISGIISGGITGGIMGGLQFKSTINSLQENGLTYDSKTGIVDEKMPLKDYLKYRKMSVHNPKSDTMTLGKYEPTIMPDGTSNYDIPGPGSYVAKAGDTTYFSLGTEWDNITNTYNMDSAGKDMFKLFNQPALNDAVNAGKTIRFSHNPTAYGDCALKWEWDYLSTNHGYTDLLKMGDFWYGIK